MRDNPSNEKPRDPVLFTAVLTVFAIACTNLASAQISPSIESRLASLERELPKRLPSGAARSIRALFERATAIEGDFPEQSKRWTEEATQMLASAEGGQDPFESARGKIVMRTYPSPISTKDQHYAVYLPKGYDPKKSWPLMIVLHGGSSNGNLFLGVVLGNNMNWKQYRRYWWNWFDPKWHPDWIVASPDGFGQVMWRWMGEQDIFAVIEDVGRHYNVDADRIVLTGLSNGGVGAYSVGTRHASKFSAVQAIAGAPSWLQYGGKPRRVESERVMKMLSGLHLAANIGNTDFRYFHGTEDGGPMKPSFVREYEQTLKKLELPAKATWYPLGHDILYPVLRHGNAFPELARTRRNRSPRSVTLVTADYRAATQHWLGVSRIKDYPSLCTTTASLTTRDHIDIKTDNATSLYLDWRTVPIETKQHVSVTINGQKLPKFLPQGHRTHFTQTKNGWAQALPSASAKRAGMSGPLTDAYYDSNLHIYGTLDPESTKTLRKAAEKAARGWPLWTWNLSQPVIADTDFRDEMAKRHHLVVYGTDASNSVLRKLSDQLPIRVEGNAIRAGTELIKGKAIGARFIYPNPLNPSRYVTVQTGTSAASIARGNNLPDFLPDYVIYDAKTTQSRPRLTFGSNAPLRVGFFDSEWNYVRPEQKHRVDQSPWVSRALAKTVATFKNYRANHEHGTWEQDATWQIRERDECERALQKAKVPFARRGPQPSAVPNPVEITGPIQGFWFRMAHEDRPLVMACELAARLPKLVSILKKHGMRGAEIISAYRTRPRTSFHTLGLGLDISRLFTGSTWLALDGNFDVHAERATCPPPPSTGNKVGDKLYKIACDIFDSKAFSTVLTPNYNEGHRDHFHLDIRPNDPRLFVR